MIKYGDEVCVSTQTYEMVGTVMSIDDDQIEITGDGGDTSRTFWLDDVYVDLMED